MKQENLIPLIVTILLVVTYFPPTIAQDDSLSPIILIYSSTAPDWGNRLADLIMSDDRFDAEIQIVNDRVTFETVVNFPRVQAVIICPLARERITLGDISGLTAAYFLDGGAVVGIGVSCTSRYAPLLGPSVFSIGGNRSLSAKRTGGRRVFQYNLKEIIPEINGEIPAETFHMEGYLSFYTSNSKGEYVAIPANGTRHILYEGEKNAPMVVAFQSESGGSSVAFPGLTVQEVEGKDNYYGHLFERQEFKQLFLNGLKWAIDNSPRFQRLKNSAPATMETEASRRADLAAEGDKLEKKIEGRRMFRLGILWGVGLIFCIGVAFKFILVRDEE